LISSKSENHKLTDKILIKKKYQIWINEKQNI